ncbi:(E,E)-geranyllinalool synthase [Spatholobus suberectus]|nr:(E,E)-geranyllinalool synthase [Spatholobus suberectus]
MIDRGLAFIEANTEKLLKDIDKYVPRWFTILFPAMIELSESVDLEIVFPDAVTGTVSSIFCNRQNLLDKEELVGKHYCFPPLLSYLEALPPSYTVSEEDICSNLGGDGSLFQSPSATAKAFMATGKIECLAYLQSVIQRCPNGVPQTYPMDEDLIKLCMVNQLQRLGLAEHFVEEIEEILARVYRNYVEQEGWIKPTNTVAVQLHKDSLAFQLLRIHGYRVSPSLSFRWFLDNEEIKARVEKQPEFFSTTMLYTYRASSLMFCGECELEEVKSFSRNLLEKSLIANNGEPHVKLSQLQKMVERELNIPWLARLDHLDHRTWIEENEANLLWIGKTSYDRISLFHNTDLLKLAMQNYEFRQSVYKNELEELNRWSQNNGLTNMGFGREKTTYCYYAIAAATSYPHDSYIRNFVAKNAILITVVDDFFDMEGSLSELEGLTDAVKRWDCRGLKSHSKVIFDALDNLVNEAAREYLKQGGIHDIKISLQDLKEIDEGKLNFLLLNLTRNQHFVMEDSIAFVKDIIDKKKKEFLQHALVDGQSDLPKPSKMLHLTCLKVFEMFYGSSNGFDSDSKLLEDINKALYLPLSRKVRTPKILSLHSRLKIKHNSMQKPQFIWSFKHKSCISFSVPQVSPPALRNGYGIIPVNTKALLPGFI